MIMLTATQIDGDRRGRIGRRCASVIGGIQKILHPYRHGLLVSRIGLILEELHPQFDLCGVVARGDGYSATAGFGPLDG